MDLVVGAAEEAQRERTHLDRVTGVHDRDVEAGRRLRHALRSEDRDAGVLAEDPIEVIGRPVVRMLMGERDRDDVAQIEEGVGERTGVDDEGLALVADGEGGVLVLRDSHAPSQARRCRVGKRTGRGGLDFAGAGRAWHNRTVA
ncbi:hypothetical protein GCM10009778_23390 [Microbacterium terricola]